MAFQSQLIFPVRKCSQVPIKKALNEKKTAKRVLFDSSSSSPTKRARQNENSIENVECSKSVKKLQSASSFVLGKQIFHTGQLSKVVGRTEEITEIDHFISEHIIKRQAGSMYISGAPGTGKTTCLMSVVKAWEKKISYAFVNCMSVSNPSNIYKCIAKEFNLPSKIINSKNCVKSLEKYIVSSSTMNILVLDEIDHLDSKGQEVLYSLFEWPQLPKSSLILIGIANALDLTDRMLPRLHAFKCQPKLMHFQPYTRQEIVSILEDRLSNLQNNNTPIIKPVALQLCARKVAACTGDIRKALDVCRRATEIVENKRKREFMLQSTSDDRCNPGSPMKRSVDLTVDICDISAVLHEVYGSRLQASESSKTVTMPLQQMILLCTLILMKKHCKVTDMNLGKLYDVYKRICKKKDITAVGECEFNGLCKLVETRGFIELKPSKVARMTKIILKIDESEAEFILQDKVMLPSILSDKSVLSNS